MSQWNFSAILRHLERQAAYSQHFELFLKIGTIPRPVNQEEALTLHSFQAVLYVLQYCGQHLLPSDKQCYGAAHLGTRRPHTSQPFLDGRF